MSVQMQESGEKLVFYVKKKTKKKTNQALVLHISFSNLCEKKDIPCHSYLCAILLV